MYAKAAMNVCKSCRKLKINFIVPPLGRMNTNANPAEDYKPEPLFGRSNVNMAMPNSVDDAFEVIGATFLKTATYSWCSKV